MIPAGAGSGKTHRIQQDLIDLIRDKKLAPERIVAVTFTEAAAAELRGRIRAALVENKLFDEAIRLDRAYISTIHSFGLRLLTEFAFEGGLSPVPRMLNDDEQSMLVSRSLKRSESAVTMMQRLTKYGYRDLNNKDNEKSAEQVFRETILKFIATLRTIGSDADAGKYASGIEEHIRSLYGDTRLAANLKDRLLDAVQALLSQYPTGVADKSNVTDSIKETLRNESILLQRAAKGYTLDSDWELWQKLSTLKTYKNPDKYFPSGYQELAEEVIAAAQCLPQHPGPLADALEHASLLLAAAADCLDAFRTEKQERSLIDFTDMVALSRQLLCLNDDVIACLKERISCLVIDEFQDTNPLQFSLLWALSRKGIPTIIVGDLKQAIMGFQGADPRLLKALCEKYPDQTDPLTGNWRTDARLMNIINSFGKGLFGREYIELKPMAGFSSELKSPLELLVADKSLKNDVWASHLVGRLHTLLNDPDCRVFDKKLGCQRRFKGGDIAILCPTARSRMKAYADALRSAGIPCRMQEGGWYQSRIVQIACYALAYVADPGDIHAALYLSVTEFGGMTLQDALKTLIAKGDIRQPQLHGRLDDIAGTAVQFQVDEVLAEVIRELDLFGRIATWEDAGQSRADLLRLQEECREFRSANREALACSGYYGSGVKTFLAWLRDRIKRDDRKPDPSLQDSDAVQLVTWHSSKGREWPVVAVCGMNGDFAPRLPDVRVDYEDFSELDNILDKVRVEILPAFASSETNENFAFALFEDATNSASRLLYVALTRAREKLILEWPAYHDGTKDSRKKKSYWDLFAEKTGAHIAGNQLVCGDMTTEFYRIASDADPWVVDVPLSSRKLSTVGRRAIKRGETPAGLHPESVTPSSLHGKYSESVIAFERQYGEALSIDISDVKDSLEKGKLLHRAFEVLSWHPERKHLLSDALGHRLTDDQVKIICDAVAAFDKRLDNELKPVEIMVEVPLLIVDGNGSIVHGFADMIAETDDGLWVIDHKSDQVPGEAERLERWNYYFPQLKCYADALTKARKDKPVKGVIANWVTCGIISAYYYRGN